MPQSPEHPFNFCPRANKMAEASAKDAMPNTTSAGGPEKVVLGRNSSRKGEVAEGAGDASKWKKRVDALFHLDTLQEQASNHVSSAMRALVQRTGIVKEVCIPCGPQALWRVLIENPSRCS
jgi:hypothetical protein